MAVGRRLATLILLLGAVWALPFLSGRPAPARVASVPLAFQTAPGGDVWETEPIEATATVVGLSWAEQSPQRAWVRSDQEGGGWSPGVALELGVDEGPAPKSAEAAGRRPASAPVYVGRARAVQYRVKTADPSGLRAEVVSSGGGGALQRLRPRWARADASPARPDMVTREEWGGQSCLGSDPKPPHYLRRVQVMFVHHTATTNDYSPGEGPDIVSAICHYHVGTLGWWDIGYNFLVDRYGVIYEGRGGGVDRAVRWAHPGGFNSYSTGVALIGTHGSVEPTPQAQDALVRLAAWKLDVHHVDPEGETVLQSLGSSKYEAGEVVELRNVDGHRSASATACPGDACFVLIDPFRSQIHLSGGNKIYGGWPDPDPIVGNQEQGYEPATFHMRFTSPMAWTLQVQRAGGTVLAASGAGTEGLVTWDGTSGGVRLPMGWYEVVVEAVPESGDPPRPLQDTFQLGSFTPPFADDEGSVHEADIAAIAAAGITLGCNPPVNDRYCPGEPVSREQMVSFLVRAMGLPPSGVDAFDDDQGSVHQADINALAAAGITQGCGPGAFCPGDQITRGEMAAFLARARQLPPTSEDFFADDQGNIFEEDINRLAEAGITKGCNPPDNDHYCPGQPVIRAQMASFLLRAFLAVP